MPRMSNLWRDFAIWFHRKSKLGSKGPYITSFTHGIVTMFGLMPHPFGPLGIVLWWWTGVPWLWLLASTRTAAWYWDREQKQHGGRIPLRLDPVLDVAVPVLTLGGLYWFLLTKLLGA